MFASGSVRAGVSDLILVSDEVELEMCVQVLKGLRNVCCVLSRGLGMTECFHCEEVAK